MWCFQKSSQRIKLYWLYVSASMNKGTYQKVNRHGHSSNVLLYFALENSKNKAYYYLKAKTICYEMKQVYVIFGVILTKIRNKISKNVEIWKKIAFTFRVSSYNLLFLQLLKSYKLYVEILKNCSVNLLLIEQFIFIKSLSENIRLICYCTLVKKKFILWNWKI